MKMKKVISIAAALAMLISAAACNQKGSDPNATTTGAPAGTGTVSGSETSVDPSSVPLKETMEDPYAGKSHEEASKALYDSVLGDFNKLLEEAKNSASLSERFAKMAIAEAKLLEAGVLIPSSSQGGSYAISRVAPYTVTPVLWGSDSDRFHQVIVATDFIKSEDRVEMKKKHNELKGTGGYEAWAKQYLQDKGYTIKDSYSIPYTSDPKTWDYINTYRAADSEALVNIYDGLLEYDIEGVQKPALAESYTVSDDGLTYTFKIRKGVKWVDSQGRYLEVDVTAQDFVAGMQHVLDTKAVSSLLHGVIKNAAGYDNGDIVDFAEVGVKASDDYTLVYTLEKATPFFLSMLSYHTFAPLCRSFYESHGGKYGADFAAAAESDTYTYGTSPENTAYCGPYTVSNATEKATIVFKANESYWNKDNINIKTITWNFVDGKDPTKTYNDTLAGTIDGAGLNSSTLPVAKSDGNFDKYHYVTATNATSFTTWVNIYRQSYANFNDPTKVVSTFTTDEQKLRANLAAQNQHFRLALAYALDKATYNSKVTTEETKLFSIRNSYTPGNFVSLAEDVKVSINGTETEFKAGTNYGAILQAQITADGYPIKVYDPTADDGAGSSDGFDGWYNPEAAKSELNKAIAELRAVGVEITKEKPLHIEYPCPKEIPQYSDRGNAYKKSVEASLDGLVVVDLVDCMNGAEEWYNATYYFDTADGANYNVCDNGGWDPDYGDPQAYLNTMLPDFMGDMTKMIGIY